MPRIALTDIVLKHIKAPPAQTQFWDASLPTFGCRVSPAGTKTFNVMIGKDRRLIKIGNYPSMTLAIARRRAHEIIDEADTNTISFLAARDLFFQKHLDTLKATTAHEQKNLMRRFPFSKPLHTITQQDIFKVVDEMPRGSARSCFNVFRTFLNWCAANNYLDHTPLKGRSPYKTTPRERLLSDEEMQTVWNESHNHSSFGQIMRLLLLTGQRLNQITSLQKDWLVDRQFVFPAHIMKSNSTHTMPLTETALCQLQPLSREATSPSAAYSSAHPNSMFFFPNRTGDRPFQGHSYGMAAIREALPTISHWTLHDFRRYFSSTMAKIGTPIHITEQLLAHTTGSRSQIQRTYDRHTYMNEMRTALENYERYLADHIM